MSPIRLVAVVLLVVVAGCTGGGVGGDDTTTEQPTGATTDVSTGEPTDGPSDETTDPSPSDETTDPSPSDETTDPSPSDETTDPSPSDETTDPSPSGDRHTGEGTSHAPAHLTVRAAAGLDNVTVTLSPDGDAATYEIPAGEDVELTREIHDRGHDVQVVVERGEDVVFDKTVYDYEYHEVRVDENSTSVSTSVV